MTSSQTFAKHTCAQIDSTASALEKAFEIDEDSEFNNYVMFNPSAQRQVSLFSALHVGEELMVD